MFSLIFVAVVLLGAVVASLVWAKHASLNIDVDLPADFESPFQDVDVEIPPPVVLEEARIETPAEKTKQERQTSDRR